MTPQELARLKYPIIESTGSSQWTRIDTKIKERAAFLSGYEAAQPKWISVEDDLPKDGKPVLCLHIFSLNHFVCYRTKDCLTDEPKWYGGAKPTHWMPLPQPPVL